MIQVIDFNSSDAPKQFTQSIKETGFGVIKNHPINHQLIDDTFSDWASFFNSDEKNNYTFNPESHDGFASTDLSETAKGFEKKDIKEFYHYYEGKRCPDSTAHNTQNTFKEMSHLAQTLLGWIEDNTPEEIAKNFSMPLAKMIENSGHTLLRILHYPAFTGNEEPGAVRAAPHEDINLITLLPAATASGLQVLSSEGKWLDIPYDPNSIIVNIGDMLDECTNGYYKATKHRVINPEASNNTSRFSMPLFLHPIDGVVLSKRHTSDSYRAERFKELGLN